MPEGGTEAGRDAPHGLGQEAGRVAGVADTLNDLRNPHLKGARGAKVVTGGALALQLMELGPSYKPRLGPPASLTAPCHCPGSCWTPAQASALVFDHSVISMLAAKSIWNMYV